MRKFVSAAAVVVAACVMTPNLDAANRAGIRLQADQPWLHESTGFKLPASAAGFNRLDAKDFGNTQSDVAISYTNDATKTFASVFIYRAGVPDVSVWAERSDIAIHTNAPGSYGKLNQAGRRFSAFTPWPNSKDGGLRIGYDVSGKEAKSTGLLMVRHGDWLIAVRMTSFLQNAAQTDQALADFFAALNLPAPAVGSGPAYAIQACKEALPTKSAKPLDLAAIKAPLAKALPGAVLKGPAPASLFTKAVFCRDKASQPGYSVFRANAARDAYLIAAGDSGVTLVVSPDLAMRTIDPSSGAYAATIILTDQQIGLAPYASMPSAKQVMESIEHPTPTYARSRLPGEEAEVTLAF